MIQTWGLTHVAIAVRDIERSAKFYKTILGAVEVYKHKGFVQLQTPGTRDVLVLEKKPELAGKAGGVIHFGFRLKSPGDIDEAAREIVAAGGKVREQGQFVPGEPYLFANDPDGYEIEIWFERPTSVDPA
jgi:catechol 2,3-dioxygenase-like lactoylglutathione lyase family enzyme